MKINRAFTLMELMIVIAIIMILSGAIVARIGTGGEKAKIARAYSDLEQIATACRSFNIDTSFWPFGYGGVSIYYLMYSGRGGIQDDGTVIHENKPGMSPKVPYLESKPIDPWGNEYVLTYEGGYGASTSSIVLWAKCAPPHDDIKILVHKLK